MGRDIARRRAEVAEVGRGRCFDGFDRVGGGLMRKWEWVRHSLGAEERRGERTNRMGEERTATVLVTL